MKIIGFDYPCMDMNVSCDRMPQANDWLPMTETSLMGGGKVANAIIAAARQGADTAFIGRTGDDRYGRLCREDLQRHGTEVSQLKCVEGHTALCLSIVDRETSSKHFIESLPTFSMMTPEDVQELPGSFFRKGDYLMLYQMDETAAALAKRARQNGAFVEVDGDEYDERTEQALPLIDILVMSEYYYRKRFDTDRIEPDAQMKKNLEMICGAGPKIAVVTLGENGCAGIENGEFFKASAYKVQVRDTIGAGDVFHGAFVYGLSEGKKAEEAARYASAVSAIKCTVIGGRTGIPTRDCTERFMETGVIGENDFAQREAYYREIMWK